MARLRTISALVADFSFVANVSFWPLAACQFHSFGSVSMTALEKSGHSESGLRKTAVE